MKPARVRSTAFFATSSLGASRRVFPKSSDCFINPSLAELTPLGKKEDGRRSLLRNTRQCEAARDFSPLVTTGAESPNPNVPFLVAHRRTIRPSADSLSGGALAKRQQYEIVVTSCRAALNASRLHSTPNFHPRLLVQEL